MLLTAAWCKARRAPLPIALTVDHGLRKESAAEAARVAKWAGQAKVPHETLVWTGRKPAKNIQALAREARYRLIGERLRARGVETLLTGHTLDDQAETFLLRLARGSGLDGLSGMAPVAPYPLQEFAGVWLARPLLGFSHARLIATLRARKQKWIEDPSNANDRFARIQIRNVMPALAEAGATVERVASAAAHLHRARDAIDAAVGALIEGGAELSPWGYALLKTEAFAAAPREVALRALARLIEVLGGGEYPPRFEQTEQALGWLLTPGEGPAGRTLGGCRLARRDSGTVLAAREETALAKEDPVLHLKRGERGLWDRRYLVALDGEAGEGEFEVRRLGPAGLKAAGTKASLPQVEPHRIGAAVPALWQGERLAAAPLLGFSATEPRFSARFVALSRLTGG
jgi:tRNA(Ile)-lysidine synthase